MIMVPALVLGVFIGVSRAKRKNGTSLDILQYAAVHGIIFFIAGMFLTVALGWLGLV